jgi:diacylglycerol kinase (ATP)
VNTLILLNRASGMAAARWSAVREPLEQLLGVAPLVCDDTARWAGLVSEWAGSGPCRVLSAGGDGTLHSVINLFMRLPEAQRSNVYLGAVGLGSGNDFLKEPRPAVRIGGIGVRCRAEDASPQNLLRVERRDAAGQWQVEYAATSCSVGLIAIGNDRFTRRRGLTGVCWRFGPGAAIAAASLEVALRPSAIGVRLAIAAGADPGQARELFAGRALLAGAYVNRHFAGGLTYGGTIDPCSPAMGITVLPELGLVRRLAVLHTTSSRTGMPAPPAACWQGDDCSIILDEPGLAEMDGEVMTAREIRVRLVRGALRMCR